MSSTQGTHEPGEPLGGSKTVPEPFTPGPKDNDHGPAPVKPGQLPPLKEMK